MHNLSTSWIIPPPPSVVRHVLPEAMIECIMSAYDWSKVSFPIEVDLKQINQGSQVNQLNLGARKYSRK